MFRNEWPLIELIRMHSSTSSTIVIYTQYMHDMLEFFIKNLVLYYVFFKNTCWGTSNNLLSFKVVFRIYLSPFDLRGCIYFIITLKWFFAFQELPQNHPIGEYITGEASFFHPENLEYTSNTMSNLFVCNKWDVYLRRHPFVGSCECFCNSTIKKFGTAKVTNL